MNLIQIEKTEELEPGASAKVSFEIAKEDMASYDSEGIKLQGGGYILEAGEYTVSVRSDSHTVEDEETFQVEKDIDYSKDGRESDMVTAVNQFQEYARGDFEQLSRKDGFANYEEACAAPAEEQYVMSDEVREKVIESAVGTYDGTKYNDDLSLIHI